MVCSLWVTCPCPALVLLLVVGRVGGFCLEHLHCLHLHAKLVSSFGSSVLVSGVFAAGVFVHARTGFGNLLGSHLGPDGVEI